MRVHTPACMFVYFMQKGVSGPPELEPPDGDSGNWTWVF